MPALPNDLRLVSFGVVPNRGKTTGPEGGIVLRSIATALGSLAGIAFALTAAIAAPEVQMAQIQRADLSSASFRVDVPEPTLEEVPGTGEVVVSVPGYGPFAPEGAPDLPHRSFLIGIPEGAEPILQVRALGSRLLPGVRPRPAPEKRIEATEGGLPTQTSEYVADPTLYGDEFPQVWARLGERGRLRHLSVVRVEVFPYRWDPGMPGIEMATALEVTVSWPQPANRPAGRQMVVRDHESWERTYARAVLNWEAARSFRSSPGGWERSGLRRQVGSGPQMRLEVDTTGIYRVTYEDLVAAGWDVGPVPIEQLALEERRFEESDPEDPFHAVDIPIYIADYDENGSFNEEDAIFFFGLNAWDSFHPHPRIKRYGRTNAYWLFTRPEGGARMEQIPSTLGRTDLTSETQFVWTERLEGDGIYMDFITSSETFTPKNGILNIQHEHFYWMGAQPGEYLETIELPGAIRGKRLRGVFQGILAGTGIPSVSLPRLSFGLPGGPLVEMPTVELAWRTTRGFDFGEEVVGTVPLADRTQMRLFMSPEEYGAALDWIEWTYDRNYRSFEDRISFQTGQLTGPRQFDLSGFSSTDIVLFEVSDSLAPRLLTFTEDQTFREQGRRTLRVQLDLGAAPSRRVFTAVEGSAALEPEIARASDRDISAPAESNLIVITHASFQQGLQPLLDLRRSEGWDVEVVTSREVFDQFDGGRATPTAIRNYLRYLFRSRTVDPTHLLLVGDGSNDFSGVLPQSAPNFMPTQTIPSEARSTFSELVACDVWFVDNLTGTGEEFDFLSDMHVGRLPVGSQTELNNMVSKIVGYANFRDADQWRNRGITMADDEFSSRLTYDGDYVFRPEESVFRRGGEISNRIIRESGFTDFQPDSFYLECYLDTVACLRRCLPINPDEPNCANRTCELAADGCGAARVNAGEILDIFQTQDVLKNQLQLPRLFQTMVSRGYLYVAFQSHGNRALAAHEEIWQEQPGGRSDSAQLQNVEKPFLFLGFGCHFAHFGHADEASFGRGDCLAEKMLFLDQGRGAVAAFASTAFEWLNANDLLQIAMMRVWFVEPTVDAQGHAQWILGDLIDQAKWELQRTSSLYGPPQSLTYTLLGDPTMTIDLAPPRVDRVEVNGAPWITGEPLFAESGSDSARVSVWLRDEVWIQSVTVLEGGVEIDPSRYAVVPDPAHAADGRRAILQYHFPLDVPESDYSIEVRGRDRAGRVRSVSFPVRLETRFELQRPEGWAELRAGDIISVGDSVRVTVVPPITRGAGDFDLILDGKPLPAERAPVPGSEFGWRIQAAIPFVKASGSQALEVSVARRDGGEAIRSVSLVGSVGEGDVELTSVYNFPNPFTTDTRFLYHLNGAGRGARLRVFTLRGQKIYETDGTARPGENVILWDGRDMDGDEIANGVYLYKLEVDTAAGRTLSRIERVARIR